MDFAKIFNDSYNRALSGRTSRANEFFDAFYERFIASDPSIEKKFQGVDMASQKAMLKQSIAHLSNLFVMHQVPELLKQIAIKHDQQHVDVEPHLYDLWLECLIDTARNFDPQFDDQVELAWRMVCAQGITLMTHTWRKSGKKTDTRA
ncbi:MAG: globin domain-containing protein [Phycisphaeraceae bacterium]|nr:globin domain-containing protein [Phycisphaeraceae bacterium]